MVWFEFWEKVGKNGIISDGVWPFLMPRDSLHEDIGLLLHSVRIIVKHNPF